VVNASVAQPEARQSNVPAETVGSSLIELEERSLCKRRVGGSSPSRGSYSQSDAGTSGEPEHE
jgi:hypothetical protein